MLLKQFRAGWKWPLLCSMLGAAVAVAFDPTPLTVGTVLQSWLLAIACTVGAYAVWAVYAGRKYADFLAGQAALERFDAAGAEICFRRALDRARRGNNRNELADALTGLGTSLALRGHHSRSILLFSEALPLARATGHRQNTVSALVNLSADERWLGRFDEATQSADEALGIAQTLADRALIGWSLSALGATGLSLGDYAGARTVLDEALATRIALDDRRGAAFTLNNLGLVEALTADFERGVGMLAGARERFAEAGDRGRVALVLGNLGFVYARHGAFDQAEAHFRDLAATNPELDPVVTIDALIGLSLVAAGRGDWSTAVSLLACADAERQRHGLGLERYREESAEQVRCEARAHLDGPTFADAHASGAQAHGIGLLTAWHNAS